MASDKQIKLKINVLDINKDWLFQGEKGVYLNMTLFYVEESDTYGQNGMITQDVPQAIYKKEVADKVEKGKMTKGPILGNAKVFAKAATKETTPGSTEGLTMGVNNEAEDDLPF